jgi:hypothetical protein
VPLRTLPQAEPAHTRRGREGNVHHPVLRLPTPRPSVAVSLIDQGAFRGA